MRRRLALVVRSLSVLTLFALISACSPAAQPASPTSAPAKPAAAPTTAPAAQPTTAAPAAAAKPTTAAAPAAQPAASASNAEWDRVVAAAKSEKLVIVTHPGAPYQKLVASFKAAYPDIAVEHSGERPSDISPKIITEQKNGQYLWDVMVAATSNMNNVLLPAGAFQELPPFMIRDDYKQDSLWGGGKFEWYTSDKGKFVFIHNFSQTGGTWVNRDFISKEQYNSNADLLKPEFRGKIVMDDPSVPAHGSLALTGMWAARGEDFVRKIFVEVKPVIQENVRVTTEWVATGRYPIGIGVDEPALDNFKAQGVGKSVEQVVDDPYLLSSGVAVFKNAPHPNASKVFVNWFLSKEGQQAWVAMDPDNNTRRVDIPVQDPTTYPDYAKPMTGISIQGTDAGAQLMTNVQTLYKQVK